MATRTGKLTSLVSSSHLYHRHSFLRRWTWKEHILDSICALRCLQCPRLPSSPHCKQIWKVPAPCWPVYGSETLTGGWPDSMGIYRSRKGQPPSQPGSTLKNSRDSNKFHCLCWQCPPWWMSKPMVVAMWLILMFNLEVLMGISAHTCSVTHILPTSASCICTHIDMHCTPHAQAWMCTHRCTHTLFYSSDFILQFYSFFFCSYLCFFFIFSYSFSTLPSSVYLLCSTSLFSQPQF